jgi:hypothetical protein
MCRGTGQSFELLHADPEALSKVMKPKARDAGSLEREREGGTNLAPGNRP